MAGSCEDAARAGIRHQPDHVAQVVLNDLPHDQLAVGPVHQALAFAHPGEIPQHVNAIGGQVRGHQRVLATELVLQPLQRRTDFGGAHPCLAQGLKRMRLGYSDERNLRLARGCLQDMQQRATAGIASRLAMECDTGMPRNRAASLISSRPVLNRGSSIGHAPPWPIVVHACSVAKRENDLPGSKVLALSYAPRRDA